MKTHQLETALDALDRLDPDLKSARAEFGNPPDRFEVASFSTLVRIILGQQISRAVAAHLWDRMKAKGWHNEQGLKGLAYEDLQAIGLSRRKSEYIIDLAHAINSGELDLDALHKADRQDFRNTLIGYRGIGDWTAEYVAMRALKNPDAFPAADLGLLRAFDEVEGRRLRPAELQERSLHWRPWRAYAALLIWSSDSGAGG